MNSRRPGFSPQPYARSGGWLYLVIIVAGIFAEAFVRGRLIVSGNAAATAHNILAHESLFRAGFAAELVAFCCDVALALILYVLLRPVHRNLALLAAFFRVVFAAIIGLNTLNHFKALLFLQDATYLQVFSPAQLQALALLSLKTHGYGYHVSLVFFGVHCLLVGHLIYRSGFLPGWIGALLGIAGLCYLASSFSAILAPAVFASLSPAILVPAFVAELSLCLWLIVRGVDVARWRESAAAPAA